MKWTKIIPVLLCTLLINISILASAEECPDCTKPHKLTGYWEGKYKWTCPGWSATWPIGLGIHVDPEGRVTGIIGVYTSGDYGRWTYKVTGHVKDNKIEFTYKGTTHNHLFKGTIEGSNIKGTFERSDGHYAVFELNKCTKDPIELHPSTGYWEGSYSGDSVGDDPCPIGLGIDISTGGEIRGVIGMYNIGYYGNKCTYKVSGEIEDNQVEFSTRGSAHKYIFTGTVNGNQIKGQWQKSNGYKGTFKLIRYIPYKMFIPDDYPIPHPKIKFFDNFNDGNIDGWNYDAGDCYSFGGSVTLKGRFAENSYVRCDRDFNWQKPFRIDVSLKFIDLIHPPLSCMGARFHDKESGKYVGVYIRNEPPDSGADPYGEIVEIYRKDKDYDTVSFNWNVHWFYNLTFVAKGGKVSVYVKRKSVNSIDDEPILVGEIGTEPIKCGKLDLFTYSASAQFDYVIVSSLEGKTIYVPEDYPTIREAVDAAEYGDTIKVGEGRFRGAILKPGIKVIGSGADKTKLWWLINAASDCAVENLAMINGYVQIRKGAKNVVVKRLLLDGAGYGILARGDNTFVAENNTIVNQGYIDRYGYPQGAGIYYQQNSTVVIRNNIIANNPGYGIVTWWHNSTDACEYNDVYNNGKDYVIAKPGEGSISEDPLFKDEENGDYHLTRNSLCIDAGDPRKKYNDPDGSRNDMGVFPYDAPDVTVKITRVPREVLKNHKYTVEWKLEGDFEEVEQTEMLWGLASGEYTHSGKSFSGKKKKYKDTLRAPKMKKKKTPFYVYLAAHALVEGDDFYSEEKKVKVIHDKRKKPRQPESVRKTLVRYVKTLTRPVAKEKKTKLCNNKRLGLVKSISRNIPVPKLSHIKEVISSNTAVAKSSQPEKVIASNTAEAKSGQPEKVIASNVNRLSYSICKETSITKPLTAETPLKKIYKKVVFTKLNCIKTFATKIFRKSALKARVKWHLSLDSGLNKINIAEKLVQEGYTKQEIQDILSDLACTENDKS